MLVAPMRPTQKNPDSTVQVVLHPSLPTVLLSSHPSEEIFIPLPQTEAQLVLLTTIYPNEHCVQPFEMLQVWQFEMAEQFMILTHALLLSNL
jgi:hypothetical protein